MILIDILKDLLFPGKCILCRRVLSQDETDLCHDCRSASVEYSRNHRRIPGIGETVILWNYEGHVRESLLRFKFSGKSAYGEIYGRLLAMKLTRENVRADLITWVPVSPKRRRERGYDQSELIARSVGRELGVQTRPLLRKLRHNTAQSEISGAARRRENVQDAYAVTEAHLLQGRRILLIDDILTTGATAGECARMLRAAGAERITLAVVASGKNADNDGKHIFDQL